MKNYKPTTQSRRHMTGVDYSDLEKKKPLRGRSQGLKNRAGRNNQGRITMRHQGGGNKRVYRQVDFKQDRFDIPATVENLEYDPNRSAFLARIVYKDGRRDYILAAQGMKAGDTIVTSEKAEIKPGNRLPLRKIPVGYQVHNVELQRGSGGKIARAAGTSVSILAHDAGYTDLQMASREIRKVPWDSLATIGQVSNPEWGLISWGKAGRSRWLGVRPTVRGSAMNPRDHKYGGGEGRQRRGTRRPKDIWGNITGGKKTRKKNKWSDKLIIKRRTTKKSK